ncbi:MAG TPA: hypothetical protein VLS44_09345, partial [Nitrospira sp.]|nr:hypothetical protein [Nitrospira sp.]
LRDAIAHPSPGPNLIKKEPGKEKEFSNTDFYEIESIVDNSIALVRKIERLIRNNRSVSIGFMIGVMMDFPPRPYSVNSRR